MGCAGRVANGVNTVCCCYATPVAHALVGARVWVPAGQLDDADRRAALGIGDEVSFRTRPELAIDIGTDMVTDQTIPSWCAGDEVYGRSAALRTFCEENKVGYVLRVGCAFHLELAPGTRGRADALVRRFTGSARSWQRCSVAGSKGERAYAWAWLATTSPHHHLLIRRHLATGEFAYHYCFVPPGRTVTLISLVRVACLRWPVEETLCATKRAAVSPVQPGGTRREVSGSDGLPGAERLRGQEHARKPTARSRRLGWRVGGPA